MEIRAVDSDAVEEAAEALVSAFGVDPLLTHLFGSVSEREADVAEFFRILLEVRVALRMPAFLARENGRSLGAAMGYDTSRPSWPEEHMGRWSALLNRVEGLEGRFDEYEKLAEKFKPRSPHYYLGVIGVREGRKGSGVGKALLDEFCAASSQDGRSSGVCLETASEPSLRFYLKNGFVVQGEGTLGGETRLWCVFRGTGQPASPARAS